MKWQITDEQDGMLLRDYLTDVCGFSRRIIKAIKFEGGSLLINGLECTVRKQLNRGDVLTVILPNEARGSFMGAENLPLDIVYEDDDVLVINKPAGVATIPSLHHPTGTIANRLLGYYEEKGLPFTVHVVTRLDRDTSGLMLVAKHRFSHYLLSNDQKSGRVNRSYYAIVEGILGNKTGKIDAPIGRKADSIIQRTVTNEGQHAITYYKVVDEREDYSLVEVKLETGRTHQIRVHFTYLGHPLLGDDLYGGKMDDMDRQALHCKALEFYQPTSKKQLSFHCSLPDDMDKLLS